MDWVLQKLNSEKLLIKIQILSCSIEDKNMEDTPDQIQQVVFCLKNTLDIITS